MTLLHEFQDSSVIDPSEVVHISEIRYVEDEPYFYYYLKGITMSFTVYIKCANDRQALIDKVRDSE